MIFLEQKTQSGCYWLVCNTPQKCPSRGRLPLPDAHIHGLDVALEQSLAVLQVVQNLQHLLVHLVDLAGHVAANARLVEQKRYAVSGGHDKWHLHGGGGLAPVLGQTVGRIGEHRMAGLAGLERAVHEQTLQGGVCLLCVR